MQDENGIYYFAQPGNVKIRVYVRKGLDDIEFRLWNMDHPDVWEKHEWVPYKVLQAASRMYQKERNPNSNPMNLYDINIANALLSSKKS